MYVMVMVCCVMLILYFSTFSFVSTSVFSRRHTSLHHTPSFHSPEQETRPTFKSSVPYSTPRNTGVTHETHAREWKAMSPLVLVSPLHKERTVHSRSGRGGGREGEGRVGV